MIKDNNFSSRFKENAIDHGVFVAQSEQSLGELVIADRRVIALRNQSLDGFMKRIAAIKL